MSGFDKQRGKPRPHDLGPLTNAELGDKIVSMRRRLAELWGKIVAEESELETLQATGEGTDTYRSELGMLILNDKKLHIALDREYSNALKRYMHRASHFRIKDSA